MHNSFCEAIVNSITKPNKDQRKEGRKKERKKERKQELLNNCPHVRRWKIITILQNKVRSNQKSSNITRKFNPRKTGMFQHMKVNKVINYKKMIVRWPKDT